MVRITETGVPKEEQETVCVWSAIDSCWIISSSYRKHITKLLKAYPEATIVEQYESGTPTEVEITLEEDLITFRKPTTEAKRELGRKLAQNKDK